MIYRGTLCSYFGRDVQVADILFFKSFVHSMDPDLSILLAFFPCDAMPHTTYIAKKIQPSAVLLELFCT